MSDSKITNNKKLKRIISTFLTFFSSTLLCLFFLLSLIIVHLISNIRLLVAFNFSLQQKEKLDGENGNYRRRKVE